MKFKRHLLKTLTLAVMGLALSPVFAQSDYPNRPIKLVVPFPPGGTSDVMGRLMADELGKILKQALWWTTLVAQGALWAWTAL